MYLLGTKYSKVDSKINEIVTALCETLDFGAEHVYVNQQEIVEISKHAEQNPFFRSIDFDTNEIWSSYVSP